MTPWVRYPKAKSQRLYQEQQNSTTKRHIANWYKLVLQIGAALFYCKLGQRLLQIGAVLLIQIGAGVVTN